MSDGATGQPVEVPADTPGSSTAPLQKPVPADPTGTGRPSPADAGGAEPRGSDLGQDSTGDQGGGDGANRRRRGSRGGRGRGRSGGAARPAEEDADGPP